MPHPNEPVIVRQPGAFAMVVLDPAVDYDPDDVLVTTYPQYFAKRATSGKIIESVEVATANPGEKRTRTRK